MNWSLLIAVVLLNVPFCLLQLGAQMVEKRRGNILPRGTIIPGSAGQKFLYWQDFLTQTWGDFICLPLVAFGFFSCELSSWELYVFLAIIMITIPVMIAVCTSPNHKPDWGFPGGKAVGLGGAAHTPYFAIYTAISVLCIIKIIEGQLTGWPLAISLIGGAGWIALEIGDFLLGHLDPIKKV